MNRRLNPVFRGLGWGELANVLLVAVAGGTNAARAIVGNVLIQLEELLPLSRQSNTEALFIRMTPEARQFLFQRATNKVRGGEDSLRRSIERFVVSPLMNLLATSQLRPGEFITVDWRCNMDHLTFWRMSGQA